jgi:hypothetical protein
MIVGGVAATVSRMIGNCDGSNPLDVCHPSNDNLTETKRDSAKGSETERRSGGRG